MLTGERTVPGIPEENYWFRRHEAAYKFLFPQVANLKTVEVGCGEGYGSAMLARSASQLVAFDYDTIAVSHAGRRYGASDDNADAQVPCFVQGNLAALPVRSGSVDVVVSLQVVEHVWDHAQYVRECARILRPGGTLFLSTPNRLTFSPGADPTAPPTNPFHTYEFTGTELVGLLSACDLPQVRTYGLFAGETLVRMNQRHRPSFVDAQLSTAPAHWSTQLRHDVEQITVNDFVIREASGSDLDECLDLLVRVSL